MRYKLGEICEIVSGSTPKTSVDEYWNGNIKWITPAEISDDTYIVEDSTKKITELAVKKTGISPFPTGTVLLSSRAPIGKVAIAGCEMYCNQGFKNLICSERINNKYLYWFLKGNTEYLNSLGRGATFKEISKGIVSEIEIDVPEVEEQKKTVENLERTNRLIKLHRQELEAFDNLIKARFVEEIRPFLDAGKTVPLDELVENDRPITYGILKPGTGFPGGVPVVKVKDMRDGAIDQSDLLLTTPELDYQYRRSRLRAGDLLISIRGTVGRIAEVPESLENANITQDTARLTIKPKYNKVYIRGVLESQLLQHEMEKNIRGVAVKGINIGYLRTLGIPMCDRENQDRLAALYQQVDKSKVAVQKALEQTQLLFNSLMQQYFG